LAILINQICSFFPPTQTPDSIKTSFKSEFIESWLSILSYGIKVLDRQNADTSQITEADTDCNLAIIHKVYVGMG
jgi:hypothetical protein